jgi:hypothetical protein
VSALHLAHLIARSGRDQVMLRADAAPEGGR